MIAKIGSLVRDSPHKKRLLLAHTAGGAVGGLTAGVIAGSVGIVMFLVLGRSHANVIALLLGIALATAAVLDLDLMWKWKPFTHRQTPGSWTCTFGPGWGLFMWGADLGLSFSTRPAFLATLLLPMAAIAAGSLPVAVIIMTTYGLLRAVTVVIAIVISGDHPEATCTVLNTRTRSIGRAVGTVCLLLSVFVMGSGASTYWR